MTDANNTNIPTPPPAYAAPAVPVSQPGKTLGIVALVLAFLAAPIGAILGIVALLQSKKAGVKNGMALAAIIIGAVITVLWIIMMIVLVSAGAAAVNEQMAILCESLGSGEHVIEGVTYTCP